MELFELKDNKFGKSIYAADLIRKDTVITRFTGKPMEYQETKKLGETESYALQISPNFYLFLDTPFCFFNHSCEPNCGLDPDLKLLALREIAVNEELTFDYSTTMLERDWHLKCRCNKPACRKVITDFDRLPMEKQAYYISKNVVQSFIVDKLRPNKT